MICKLASPLAVLLTLGLACTSHAQSTPYGPGIAGTDGYGLYSYANQPYGGFGWEYAQPLPTGGLIMDQYGMLHAAAFTPYVQPAPAIPPVVRPAAPARTSRSASRRGAAQPRYQLPTGSLGSVAPNGGIIYSPEMRSQSYGYGYGHGPYGVTDYGYMWKGWSY